MGFPVLGLKSKYRLSGVLLRALLGAGTGQSLSHGCSGKPLEGSQNSLWRVLPSWRCGTCLETPLEVALRWLKCNPGQNLPLSLLEILGMGSTQNRLLLGWVLLPQVYFLIRWGRDFISCICYVSLTSGFISISLLLLEKSLKNFVHFLMISWS